MGSKSASWKGEIEEKDNGTNFFSFQISIHVWGLKFLVLKEKLNKRD